MTTKLQMITNNTTLRLNFLLNQWWDSDVLSNSYIKVSYTFRSTRPEVFLEKGVWNRTSVLVLSCKFAAYFQNTFLKNTSGRLLLHFIWKEMHKMILLTWTAKTLKTATRNESNTENVENTEKIKIENTSTFFTFASTSFT